MDTDLAVDTDLADLLTLLDLTELDDGLFQGESRNIVGPRIFGGQVIAQALIAAARTVPARTAHSLQAYFLRPGDAQEPVFYRVERIRDGGTFSTRRVAAEQHGRTILDLATSFHNAQEGPSHQTANYQAPAPEGLDDEQTMTASFLKQEDVSESFRAIMRNKTVEIRPVTRHHPLRPEKTEPIREAWIRATGDNFADDPLIQQALLAYISDHNLMGTPLLPHGLTFHDRDLQTASLDHTLWFHRPVRLDDWLFYRMESPVAYGARGFTRGQIFNREGELVASVAQEGLMRKT